MPKKVSVLKELNLNKSKGIYCMYPFSSLNKDGKGCFKIGKTSTNFTDRFNQFFTCFPMGMYYTDFLVNPTRKRTKQEDDVYYTAVEKYVTEKLTEHQAINVKSQTNINGSSEWWYTDPKTIKLVFEEAKRKFDDSEYIHYNLKSSFKTEEPDKDDVYFTGKISFY